MPNKKKARRKRGPKSPSTTAQAKPSARERQASASGTKESSAGTLLANKRPATGEQEGRAPRTGTFGAAQGTVPSALMLILLVVVSYLPAMLWGGFVWDDVDHIPGEPALRDWAGLWRIWFVPSEVQEPHYRPLTYTSFWLEHKLWGSEPTGYHVVNVLLHAANTVLLWRVLLRLAVPSAWLVAAVFAVHPLHVESVAWTIERKDVLSGLFYLACILTWLRFSEGDSTRLTGHAQGTVKLGNRTPGTPLGGRGRDAHVPRGNRHARGPHGRDAADSETPSTGWTGERAWRYCLALTLLAAGMLAKNMVVTLPAALVILHWWRHGRMTVRALLRLVPFFGVALSLVAVDLWMVTAATPAAFGYSLVERTLIASRAVWFYVGKLAWPADLAVVYPHWDVHVGDPLAWAGLGAAAALVGTLWFFRDRIGREPLAGVAFFAVTLSPTLGFVDHTYMLFSFVADRYQYLAGIGVMAVVIGAAASAVGRLPAAWRMGAMGGAAVVLALLGALTWRQAGIYSDEVTFFRHVIAHNPTAAGAHLNLAKALIALDQAEEAVTAARIAVAQRPDSHDAHVNLGIALSHLERFDEAEDHFRRAVEIAPGESSPLANLGVLLSRQNRLDEAETHLRRALEIAPRDLSVLGNLAKLLDIRQQPEASLALYDRLIARGAADAATYTTKGDLLYRLQRYDEAAVAWQRALAFDPGPTAAFSLHLSLGRAAWVGDRSADAAAPHYERALRIDPGNLGVLADLASLRIAQERYEDALHLFRTAVETAPETAKFHAGMGYALYRLGRADAAVERLERALALDPTLDEARSHLALARQSLE